MFRSITVASFLVLALSSVSVIAQTGSQSTGQAPASSSGTSAPPNQSGASAPPSQNTSPQEDRRGAAKALVAQCASDAKAKGLRGGARKDAINNCIAAQRPDLAARRECFQKGKAQNLTGDALKAFIKQCVRQGQGK